MQRRTSRWHHDDDFDRTQDNRDVLTSDEAAWRDGREVDGARHSFLERYEDVALDQSVQGDWARQLRGISASEYEEGMEHGRTAIETPLPAPADWGHRGRGPRGYRRADERIREEVCERLTDDDQIDASDIDVSVMNGEVILSGNVSDRSLKHWAEELSSRVSGVQDVVNQLTVGYPRRTTETARAPLPEPAPSWETRERGRS